MFNLGNIDSVAAAARQLCMLPAWKFDDLVNYRIEGASVQFSTDEHSRTAAVITPSLRGVVIRRLF